MSRRGLVIHAPRHQSCHTTPLQSPCSSPLVSSKDIGKFRHYDSASTMNTPLMSSNRHQMSAPSSASKASAPIAIVTPQKEPDTVSICSQTSNSSTTSSSNFNQIRSRINSFKNSVLTPRFYRRKVVQPDNSCNTNQTVLINNNSHVNQTPVTANKVPDSPSTASNGSSNIDASKSWFQRWNLRPSDSTTSSTSSVIAVERDKEYTHVINDRPLNSVKADLIHAFLSVST